MNPSLAEPASLAALAGKYLTVTLAHEAYGLPAGTVREIIRYQRVTPLPNLPPALTGVLNLRGRVVPVLDLRTRFGLPAVLGERTCIVVTQVDRTVIGLVVDAVEEVVNLTATDLQPVPEFGTHVDTACLLGLARIDDQVKMLLNVERVLAIPAADLLQLQAKA